jgi:hypothetical protein
MAKRTPLARRTWLNNSEYDRLTNSSVLHYDIAAYLDIAKNYWFIIEARAGGKELMARSVYEYNQLENALKPRSVVPELTETSWTRYNAHIFNNVHKALLSQRVALPGFTCATTRCHYVTPLDGDPWPRNMVNTYRYTMREDDPRRKNAVKRTPRKASVALPDWL